MVIRVTLLLFFSGEVEVASCSYIAGMLLYRAEWHTCVLCGLILTVSFMGGHLVFDWDRQANFLVTRDR